MSAARRTKQDDPAGAEEAPARGQWQAAQRRGRPGHPRRDAENARHARGRGHDHRGRRGDCGRGQDDDLSALADQDRSDPGRHLRHRPSGRPAGHRQHGGRHGGPRGDATGAARRLEAGGHRSALAGRVDERPRAPPGLRREGDHPVPRIAPVVHRAGDRARWLRPDLEVEALVDLLHAIPVYKILMSRGDPASLEQVPWAYLPLLAPGILSSSSEVPKSARPRSSGSSRAKRARSG